MYARTLATFCLLTSSLSAATAGSPERGVAVSLRLRSGALRAAASDEMRKELAALMLTAGVTSTWQDPNDYRDVSGYTVVVDLEGDCNVPPHAEAVPPREGTPLGSTAVAENHPLPFVKVSCNVLSALLAPFTADQPDAFRDFVLGRAIGRVLAHELYHILAQSEEHSGWGVAKAALSGADLMNSRFEFNEMALDRIHAPKTAESTPAAFDSGAGSAYVDTAADGK